MNGHRKGGLWLTGLGVVLLVVAGACLLTAWTTFLGLNGTPDPGSQLAITVLAGLAALGIGTVGVLIANRP